MPVNVNGAFNVADNIIILNGPYVRMNNVVMDAGFSLTTSVARHFSASLNANANYNITAYTPKQYQAARYFSGRIYGSVRYQDGKLAGRFKR